MHIMFIIFYLYMSALRSHKNKQVEVIGFCFFPFNIVSDLAGIIEYLQSTTD